MNFVVRYFLFSIFVKIFFFCDLGKFDIEKQNLLDELDLLKRSRDALDLEKRSRDQELRQLRDQSRLSSDDLKNTQAKNRILEQQVII